MKTRLMAGAVALMMSGLVATQASALDTLRWKLPMPFPSNLPALGENGPMIAEMIDKMSGGTIQFKVFEPGNLVPPLELSASVENGSLEAGYNWLGYDAGKIPSAPLFGARPFGMEPQEFAAWWYNGGGKELAEEIYGKRNIHPIFCGLIGPETAGWFRKPIESMEDLKGLKIRFNGLGGEILQRAGASVTTLPAAEIYQALEKGAIDASEFSMPAVDQVLGFQKIAKYNLFPGWHQPVTALHLIVNLEVWNGLADDTKAMLDTACTATAMRSLALGESLQGKVLASFDEQGVTSEQIPDEMLVKLRGISDDLMNEIAAKDEDFRRVYESQNAFSAEYQPWKERAYLPRKF